jgi:hypothetical protein
MFDPCLAYCMLEDEDLTYLSPNEPGLDDLVNKVFSDYAADKMRSVYVSTDDEMTCCHARMFENGLSDPTLPWGRYCTRRVGHTGNHISGPALPVVVGII